MANAAPVKAAPLCQFPLASGKTCRQPALNGECFCRHHMRTFRHVVQQFAHDEAIERYVARLGEMSLLELLLTLSVKLSNIRNTMPRWHQARVTLDFAVLELRRTINRELESATADEPTLDDEDDDEDEEAIDPELQKWVNEFMAQNNPARLREN